VIVRLTTTNGTEAMAMASGVDVAMTTAAMSTIFRAPVLRSTASLKERDKNIAILNNERTEAAIVGSALRSRRRRRADQSVMSPSRRKPPMAMTPMLIGSRCETVRPRGAGSASSTADMAGAEACGALGSSTVRAAIAAMSRMVLTAVKWALTLRLRRVATTALAVPHRTPRL
jgi:hypothetical protein